MEARWTRAAGVKPLRHILLCGGSERARRERCGNTPHLALCGAEAFRWTRGKKMGKCRECEEREAR